jgi:hypothetical protein
MLTKQQSNVLYTTSYFSLASSIFGLYMCQTLAILPLVVFCTSINYWRDPVHNSIRRYIDISSVVTCVSYQLYHTREHNSYIIISFCGFALYPIARYMSSRGYIWSSVVLHGTMHFICNVGNIVLYSSK